MKMRDFLRSTGRPAQSVILSILVFAAVAGVGLVMAPSSEAQGGCTWKCEDDWNFNVFVEECFNCAAPPPCEYCERTCP